MANTSSPVRFIPASPSLLPSSKEQLDNAVYISQPGRCGLEPGSYSPWSLLWFFANKRKMYKVIGIHGKDDYKPNEMEREIECIDLESEEELKLEAKRLLEKQIQHVNDNLKTLEDLENSLEDLKKKLEKTEKQEQCIKAVTLFINREMNDAHDTMRQEIEELKLFSLNGCHVVIHELWNEKWICIDDGTMCYNGQRLLLDHERYISIRGANVAGGMVRVREVRGEYKGQQSPGAIYVVWPLTFEAFDTSITESPQDKYDKSFQVLQGPMNEMMGVIKEFKSGLDKVKSDTDAGAI
ncbi:hypothetical protein F5884DRAFT_758125 [Xylogone sp. PMI_703]|nr:hypothetical protein F5884DRAFT_758125 [Xylogone sp. PMI_703]